MATRMIQRRGTEAQWISTNGGDGPTLEAGEIGFETDSGKFKIGDGQNPWVDLPYFADVDTLGTALDGDFVEITDIGAISGVAGLDASKNLLVPGASIIVEGTTNNEFETTLTVTDPTANRTITFPDASGTVALTTDIAAGSVTETGSQTLTNKTLTSPIISGLTISDASIVIEGATADDFETTITFADPTADRVITFPNNSGTVAFTADISAATGGSVSETGTQTLTNKTLSLSSNTITGTLAEFNTALTDANFAPIDSPTFAGTPTLPTGTIATTQTAGDNSTAVATTAFVGTAVSNLVDSAPATLNTLKELSDALGADANFSTTITNSLSLKAPLASPTFTGTVSGITKSMVGLENVDNTTDANKPVSTATQTSLDLKVNTSDPAVDYYIANSGSGAYLVNGVSNGTIYFEKGKKYRIHVNASGHPFWIQTVSGGYSAGNVYNTGITNNGTQSGHILVELASDAPQLYYACQYHSSMAGSIVTGTTSATYKALADLSNVNNTSDANKPVSTATQTALDLKADLASPTFTGTVTLPNSTVTNAMLAGSIANDKLANSSVTINGESVSLGGTVTIAAGPTPQAVSSNITMQANYNYFVDTTAARTLTLPASPALGDTIAIYDASGSSATNNITVSRNGNKINGQTDDALIDVNQAVAALVYTGATLGWKFD